MHGSSCVDGHTETYRKERLIMAGLWSAIASLIEAIANLGAGAASSGAAYEPVVPEELCK